MPPLLHREAEARRQRRPRRALPAPLRRAQGQGQVASLLDPERRAALLGSKLTALVASHAGLGDRQVVPFHGGAAVVAGRMAWVLVEQEPRRALGPALAWAGSRQITDLRLVVEDGAGLLARRASQFASPPLVFIVEGRHLEPAVADPLPSHDPLAPDVAAWVPRLTAAGCLVVAEHGRLLGEVAGLEVARVTSTPDGPLLEIGVGRFDREAHALISSERPELADLARVVALVAEHRCPGARPHPLNRLAPERWLRSRLLAEPDLVGARSLVPVASTVEPTDLRSVAPAPAVGEDGEGRPVVVVCSSGVDLDLVPTAADIRLARAPAARLVLALPPRDAVPATRMLAAALAAPAELATVDAS